MLRFHLLRDREEVANGGGDGILVAFNKEDLKNVGVETLKALGLHPSSIPGAMKLINAGADRLSPTKDSPAVCEFLVPDERGVFTRVCLGLLPTVCTRNNTPSLAHSVSTIVKGNKGSGNLSVVLLCKGNPSIAFAQALAVARCFPTFSFTSAARKAASENKPKDLVDVYLELDSSETSELLLSEVEILAESIRTSQHLVDMPPCKMNCSWYVDFCQKVASGLADSGVTIKVIRGKELDEQGLGGIWGVGKASDHPPALAILTHTPSDEPAAADKQSVCLVGKGIVYDTGGLSIKVPPGMNGMKDDMGGSAAVLGAFISVVKTGGLPSRRPLHALLCIAENSVDSAAFRPDDVLFMLSGKTVEVNNTDAEGRLVLGDGVHYAASRLNPCLLVDIATLTGAQLITTGKKHAAVYCSHEELEDLAMTCGKHTGDLTFPMLYAPEFHRPEFKSSVADMKNSVADRMNAQASCAAQFIGNHIEEYLEAGNQWMHVDMAGPVLAGDRASGYGVALLYDIARKFDL